MVDERRKRGGRKIAFRSSSAIIIEFEHLQYRSSIRTFCDPSTPIRKSEKIEACCVRESNLREGC